MKLNKIIYGILCLTTLNACSDQMEYKEYSNYGADYVKRTFGDVGGLVANIYLGLDTDYGNYSGAILGSATDESVYAHTGNQIADFYNVSVDYLLERTDSKQPYPPSLLSRKTKDT